MTLLPSATDFSTAPRPNDALSACGRPTPAASNKASATLATEGARPAMGSPFRTLFPFAVAVLKWCPRAVSAVPLPGCFAAPTLFVCDRPRPTPPPHTPPRSAPAPGGGKNDADLVRGRPQKNVYSSPPA